MADNIPAATAQSTITFYDNHLPALTDGEYTLSVSQKVHIKGVMDKSTPPKEQDQTFSSNPLTLYVNGPRFHLAPSDFHTIFPHDGAKGDFEGVLPSISFARSTLLWERSPLRRVALTTPVGALQSNPGTQQLQATTQNSKTVEVFPPWLFLLLVDESEENQIIEDQFTYIGETAGTDGNKASTQATNSEPQKIEDLKFISKKNNIQIKASDLGILNIDDLKFISKKIPIRFIDISKFTTNVIPTTLDELSYLGYARIKSYPEPKNPEEHAVVVGNRLPKPGSSSTVYLISLENKYINGKLDDSKKIFPVLHKWKFYTNDDQLYSINLNLDKIKVSAKLGSLPSDVLGNTQIFNTKEDFMSFLTKKNISDPDQVKQLLYTCKLPGGSFHDVMSNLRNGIKSVDLPLISDSMLPTTGSVELHSQFISNDQQIVGKAWYRGPLVAQSIILDNASFSPDLKLQNDKTKPLFIDKSNGFIPIKADELQITLKNSAGMDVSYATAFELGKLTALNDTGFSDAFFGWKQHVASAKAQSNLSSQAAGGKYPSDHHLLIQTKYLPDLAMPKSVIDKFESWKLLNGLPIRYLIPDPAMVPSESIRYFRVDNNWVNAFIMGAFSIGHTPRTDFSAEIKQLFLLPTQLRTGFILNSLAVSVWHDYEMECNATLLKKSNPDKFSHLYLYDGQISELNFHLHPGKLHPGFMIEKTPDNQKSTGYRTGYLKSGKDCSYGVDSRLIINIIQLSQKFPTSNIAEFNSFLMEGTPKVIYTLNPPPKIVT